MWGRNTGTPAGPGLCPVKPYAVGAGTRHWGGGAGRMGKHGRVLPRGPVFQLSGTIWNIHHRLQRKAQSSFHRNQPAPSPGPKAELGTVASRHVLAGWQSRWRRLHAAGRALPGELWQVEQRLEVEEAPPAFQPTCLAPASGASRGPRGVAALLRGRAEGRVGRAQQRSTGLDSCLGQASLRSLLPWSTSPLQVSLPTQTTETKDLLEGGRQVLPSLIPKSGKESTSLLCPCATPPSPSLILPGVFEAPGPGRGGTGGWRGDHSQGSGSLPTGASLPWGFGRWKRHPGPQIC